jgi:glycosyltransferase involved in cell wall biosynthesis
MAKHIVIDARIRRASTGRPVDRLLEYLQKLDIVNKYTVLVEPGDDWQPKSRRFKPVVCHYKQFSLNPLQQITFARQLYRLKPDLVHFTMTGQQPLFYFGAQITFTHDLTMFKYARAGRFPEWLHRLRMLGYRLLFWQAHRKAKKILVPSEYVRDAVAKRHLFTNRRLVVTYEASEPVIAAKAKQLEGVRRPFIMHTGSPFPHKNIDRLIEAFEILQLEHSDLQLVLSGKREYYFRQLKKVIKASPARGAIITPGFVSDAELKWLYENAEAYVLPSLSEGFGLPGLEAMAHGCPLISSDATCLPEIYGEAAHYFDPESIDDIATKIHEVLARPELRKDLITKGHKQLQKYSWEHMAEQTLVVYQNTLGA